MFVLLYTPGKKIVGPFSTEADASQWIEKNEKSYERIGTNYYAHMAKSGFHCEKRISIVPLQKPQV